MTPHPAWQGGTPDSPSNYWLPVGLWDVAVYERQNLWYIRFGRSTYKKGYTSAAEAMVAGEELARGAFVKALEVLDNAR